MKKINNKFKMKRIVYILQQAIKAWKSEEDIADWDTQLECDNQIAIVFNIIDQNEKYKVTIEKILE